MVVKESGEDVAVFTERRMLMDFGKMEGNICQCFLG